MGEPLGRKNSTGESTTITKAAFMAPPAVAVAVGLAVAVAVAVEVLSIQRSYNEKGKTKQPSYEPNLLYVRTTLFFLDPETC